VLDLKCAIQFSIFSHCDVPVTGELVPLPCALPYKRDAGFRRIAAYPRNEVKHLQTIVIAYKRNQRGANGIEVFIPPLCCFDNALPAMIFSRDFI
jgi:hypothetical protein